MIIYNKLLDFKLSPNAIKLYVYLSSRINDFGVAKARVQTMQAVCQIGSSATIYAAIGKLEEKGLIKKTNTFNKDGQYATNSYFVTELEGPYFTVSCVREILTLPKAAFLLYLYMKKRSRRNGRVWPSIRQMASDLHVCCNTVLAAIHDLVSRKLIRKATKWNGRHNLYVVLGRTEAQAQKSGSAAPSQHYHKPTEKCTTIFPKTILSGVRKIVKGVHTLLKKFSMDRCIKKCKTVS